LKLFIAVRWGNADSPDGPDGEDTHYLLRANDNIEAGKLADHALQLLPTTSSKSRRAVKGFCERIIEIGDCGSTKSVPQVMMGPWIAHGYDVNRVYYPTWQRDHEKDEWQRVQHDT
jgi:hypothetical protein